jgi:hemoglobin/transferrin/lactoferrin receptor protein
MPLQEDRRRHALAGLLLIAPLSVGAAQPGDPRIAEEPEAEQVLGAVTVQGAPADDDAQRVPSRTVIDQEELERFQPDSIFDAVQGIPGVSVNGGPRSSGMKFNIRGYSDSEDVLVKVDGATKGFEKYRFGGVFLEPELLKQVEVTRGPNLLDGSGALGGTVSATTKDAADFLAPGASFGARGKAGYGSNNDEWLGSVTVYGRPGERVDLLGSYVQRNSGDITLPDGSALEDSSVSTTSTLLKATVAPIDAATVSASYVALDDSSRQPFDATAGQAGIFGTVRRTVRDRTGTVNVAFEPGNRWIALRGVLGHSQTHVHDLSRPGDSIFANAITGDVNDNYDYDIWSYELSNRSRFSTGKLGHELTLALQGVDNSRDVTRVTQNALINNALYPNGFNPAQPPGTKHSLGVVLQDSLAFGNFTVTPGLRWDQYEITAEGGTEDILDGFGEPSSVRYTRWSPALGVSWRPGRGGWLITASYVEAFRPPLIDEAFTRGPFSRCAFFLLGPAAPASQICGSLYEPEVSYNKELSLAYAPARELVRGLRLNGRLTVFRSDVDNTLESLQAVDGVIAQPGTEQRNGLEFEMSWAYRWLYGSVSWSQIQGEVFDGTSTTDLYDVPGDTLVLQLGARLLGDRLDAGYRYRRVESRTAVVGLAPGNQLILGTQPGYRVHDVYASYRVGRYLELRFAVENLTNEEYFLDDGFGGGIGSEAPGINIKSALSVQF